MTHAQWERSSCPLSACCDKRVQRVKFRAAGRSGDADIFTEYFIFRFNHNPVKDFTQC